MIRLLTASKNITPVLVLGTVELPITREQAMEILSGDDDEGPEPTPKTTPRLLEASPATRSGPRKTGRRRRRVRAESREDFPTLEQCALAFLRTAKEPVMLEELRKAIEKRAPGALAKRSGSYLSGLMIHLGAKGLVKKSGTTGAFRFALNKRATGDGARVKVAGHPLTRQAAARAKKGLCQKCDRKAVKGKRLCRPHLDTILAAQKKAVAARKRNEAPRRHLNGAAKQASASASP